MKTKFIAIYIFSIFLFSLFGCKFWNEDYDSKVTEVSFNKVQINLNVGDSEIINLSLNPSEYQGKCNIEWEFDEELISAKTDNFGVIITGVKSGGTYIKAKCNGIVATCLISVFSVDDDPAENPYIYSSYSVIELKPSNSVSISASLYGGTIADMELFEWSIENPAIADISFSRNNCVIEAKKTGSTKIVCSHPNANFSYSFIVFVYTDILKETYITTDYNVFTINKNETEVKKIVVDLVNPLNETYKNGFSWSYADEESKNIIQINANLNEAEIVPLNNGIAKIIVSHENSIYDLEIIIRVNTIVKNTYINLSESSLFVIGSETKYTVYASIENYDGYANPDKFIWSVPDDVSEYMEFYSSGNSFSVLGKKNGVIKVSVSHELSEIKRNLLIILQEQIGSAIDASMYITTDQNYVQTKVGYEPSIINVNMIGGIDGEDNVGDEKTNFTWWIKNGVNNGIIEVQSVTGVVGNLESRTAISSGNIASGQIIITPIKEGEVTILVSHPRCLYDTEIKVKVYAETALVNPITITTDDSVIKLLNGQSQTITARVRNHSEGQENNIQWSSENESKISISPKTGQTTQITANGSGQSQTYVTAHLDGALSDRKVLVLSADTLVELETMKGIYSDSSYLRISANETKNICVESFGLSETDTIKWTSSNPGLAIVNGDYSSNNTFYATVTGLKEGTCSITASVQGCKDVIFNVTVVPEGVSSEIFDENAGYLTTLINAVVLEQPDDSTNLSVSGINISDSDMQLFTYWTMEDTNAVEGDNVFDLVGTPGANVTLTALKPGKSKLKVSNKYAENSLTINAKCGELYEWTDDYIVYITAENDVVNIINGDTTTIGCSLVNTTATGSFSWKIIQGEDIIDIIGLASGTCNISTKQAGQAIIEVSNTLAGEITKEILVNVANSEEELKGFKYLTTTQNVVTVGQKQNISVAVNIENSDTNIISGYSWRSNNLSVCEVVGSGNVAVIYGKAIGSAKVIVENYEYCSYPLEIIVNVVDPIAAAQDPYITCNSIVTCTVGDSLATVAADLVGGTESDYSAFSWAIVDNTIASLYASNNSAQIKALKEGVTQIIISHPKASVDRSILVICEPQIKTNCYIEVSESIIKMSPSDSARSITANLINGDPDDVYDFKWWADSYDKINMNYTGGSCLIEPISSGVVNIHVSHPKSSYIKDIVLYIGVYDSFAFSQKSVELTTGTNTFINMEVPATGIDCNIAYSSSNSSVCAVEGNNSVCILKPGTVTNATTCTIKAVLQSKDGVKQAEDELLVSVSKKDETKPYIALNSGASTIVNMNKGEIRSLSAVLLGKGIVDTNYDGLKWTINGSDNFIKFNTTKTTGKEVQIKALNSGKTTLSISHSEAKSPLTIYVIVAGSSDPTVTLSHSSLSLFVGEDTTTLTANVQNADANQLTWAVSPASQTYFTFNASGNKATIYPNKVGQATITCSLPGGASSSCTIKVTEPEKIAFFVYDNESSSSKTKMYISSLNIIPGQNKIVHYETVPAGQTLKNIYRSDSSYFNVTNKGYVTSMKDPDNSSKTYSYPQNVGTLVLTGTTKEGSAQLDITSPSDLLASLTVSNSYNYLFSVDKSIISTTPADAKSNSSLIKINYQISPACAKIYVTDITTNSTLSSALGVNGISSQTLDNKRTFVISSHTSTDPSTGIASGSIQFTVSGEVNADIELRAVNENIISSGGGSASPYQFSSHKLKIQAYYQSHSFIPNIAKIVPAANYSIYGDTKVCSNSFFDSTSNSFVLGDGEYIKGTMEINTSQQSYSSSYVSSIKFQKTSSNGLVDEISGSNGKYQSDYINATCNGKEFTLSHSMDYCGEINYKVSSSSSNTKQAKFYRLSNDSDAPAEHKNSTIKAIVHVGYLKVEYYSFASKSNKTYSFPVYVRVRNNPCHSDSVYNF